jgi:hypothetical protein
VSKIINLTPHAIVMHTPTPTGGSVSVTLLPSGTLARAAEHTRPAGPIDGIPTTRVSFGSVDGLPPPSDDTYYVVSALAADAAHRAGRITSDLLVPGQQSRDEQGRVIGCASLCRWDPPPTMLDDVVRFFIDAAEHDRLCRRDAGERAGEGPIQREFVVTTIAAARNLISRVGHQPDDVLEYLWGPILPPGKYKATHDGYNVFPDPRRAGRDHFHGNIFHGSTSYKSKHCSTKRALVYIDVDASGLARLTSD